MTKTDAPYKTPDEFFTAIDTRYTELSKRLQSIARELHFHRESLALMNVNDLAAAINVAPSSLVRFAKCMGFSGFSQMKNLFQQDLAEQLSDNSYADRIRQINKEQQRAVEKIPGSAMVQEIVDNHIVALQGLFDVSLVQALDDAVRLLASAESIWVVAVGRSFSSAAYFTYLIRHSDKPIHWLNGVCFNLEGQINAIKEGDVLLTISYAPYADPSRKVVQKARKRGAKIIAVTDSHLNDIAKASDVIITIRESSNFGFRTLASTTCVMQALFLLYASQSENIKMKR